MAAASGAYKPLEFCEILHAYWNGRNAASTSTLPNGKGKGKRKGNGNGSSTLDSQTLFNTRSKAKGKGKARESDDDSSAAQAGMVASTSATTSSRRLIQQGKSFYTRVDLSASPSCMRHVDALQNDPAVRLEADKLLRMAQDASARRDAERHTQNSNNGKRDSHAMNVGSSNGQMSPTKRQYHRSAQQLIHTERRAETLERRIYLRLLIAKTILRYIEKNTGCRYIFKGDRVDHYSGQDEDEDEHADQDQDGGDTRNGESSTSAAISNDKRGRSRCCFFYDCGSADYEDPVCAGTLRIVVDLVVGDYLVEGTLPEGSELALSEDVEEDSSIGSEQARLNGQHEQHNRNGRGNRVSPPHVGTIPPSYQASSTRTPITRTYGSKRRGTSLSASVSREGSAVISSAARPMDHDRLSSAHPNGKSIETTYGRASRSSKSKSHSHLSDKSFPPLVFSLRMTHLVRHKQPYKILREQYKLEKEERNTKLAIVQRKMDKLKEEMLSLQNFGEGSAAYVVKLDKLLGKVRRARTPSSESDSESEVQDEDGTDVESSEESRSGQDLPEVQNSHRENEAPRRTRAKGNGHVNVNRGAHRVNGPHLPVNAKMSRNLHHDEGELITLSDDDNDYSNGKDKDKGDEGGDDAEDVAEAEAEAVVTRFHDNAEGVEEAEEVMNELGHESDDDGKQVSDSESSSEDELPIEDPTSQDNHPPPSQEEEDHEEEDDGAAGYSEGEETAVTPSAHGDDGDDVTDYSEPGDVSTLTMKQEKKKRKTGTSSVNSSAQTKVSNGSVGKGRGRGYARGRGRGAKT